MRQPRNPAVVVATSIFLTAFTGVSAALVMKLLLLQPADIPPVDAHPKHVAGLWTLWPDAAHDGDNVRFYFFHEKGIGLYRYGKIGLNTTNSFDWRVDDNVLTLRFRKTGETVTTKFDVLQHGQGKPRTLLLLDDPKEPLGKTKSYTFVPPSQMSVMAPDLIDDDDARRVQDGAVPGRLWIDMKKFATGGAAFSLYQLKDAAIDGRGVGWHHSGDFDDWSTEALTFRYTSSSCKRDASLSLDFTLRGEHAETLVLRSQGGGLHAEGGDLTLVEDPRNYWHVKTYKDGGPSFGAARVDGFGSFGALVTTSLAARALPLAPPGRPLWGTVN